MPAPPLIHTARTRAEAHRSKAVLAERHTADTELEQQVTAQEWLQAHRAAVAEDESHCDITETDMLDADTACDRPAPDARADVTFRDRGLADSRETADERPDRRDDADVVRPQERVAAAGGSGRERSETWDGGDLLTDARGAVRPDSASWPPPSRPRSTRTSCGCPMPRR